MADETIEFDLENLTTGELVDLEEIAGIDHVQMLMKGQATAKALMAIAYLMKRRDDPSFTLEQARQLKLSSIKARPEDDAAGKAESVDG